MIDKPYKKSNTLFDNTWHKIQLVKLFCFTNHGLLYIDLTTTLSYFQLSWSNFHSC
jgi:hypothetical protein